MHFLTDKLVFKEDQLDHRDFVIFELKVTFQLFTRVRPKEEAGEEHYFDSLLSVV